MKEEIKKAVVDYMSLGSAGHHVDDVVFEQGNVRITYTGFKNASYNFGDRKPQRNCFHLVKDGKGITTIDVNYNAGMGKEWDDYWDYILQDLNL